MVMIDGHDQILVMDSIEKMSLREERRRTGRYMAAGTAIFLSLLGLYQAVSRGVPQYAALFAPALIMFIYILWILYASKKQQRSVRDRESAELNAQTPNWNVMEAQGAEEVDNVSKNYVDNGHIFSRSYSIA